MAPHTDGALKLSRYSKFGARLNGLANDGNPEPVGRPRYLHSASGFINILVWSDRYRQRQMFHTMSCLKHCTPCLYPSRRNFTRRTLPTNSALSGEQFTLSYPISFLLQELITSPKKIPRPSSLIRTNSLSTSWDNQTLCLRF